MVLLHCLVCEDTQFLNGICPSLYTPFVFEKANSFFPDKQGFLLKQKTLLGREKGKKQKILCERKGEKSQNTT